MLMLVRINYSNVSLGPRCFLSPREWEEAEENVAEFGIIAVNLTVFVDTINISQRFNVNGDSLILGDCGEGLVGGIDGKLYVFIIIYFPV